MTEELPPWYFEDVSRELLEQVLAGLRTQTREKPRCIFPCEPEIGSGTWTSEE